MSNRQIETIGCFCKRKITDIASSAYRLLGYPIVRNKIERTTGSIIEKHAYFRGGSTFEGHDFICEGAQLDNVHVGYSTMVGRYSVVSNTRIGKYTSIGGLHTYIGRHPIKGENISTYPVFYSTAKQYGYTYAKEDSFEEVKWIDEAKRIAIDIGNDVWIGAGVAVCDGVTIHDGAVIGAGSLVVKDVEPYAIYAGVPAKKIGERFPKETADKLLELKWWDKDENWIRENADAFKNPEEFLHKFCK